MAKVGILGLGEAGAEIAAGLRAAGATVTGYDPLPAIRSDVETAAEVVEGADVVISLTTAAEAKDAALSVADALGQGQIYADMNTSSASLKRELAELVTGTGAAFADVALMSPVPGKGIRTPALASGAGANALSDLMAPLGMSILAISDVPGDAATRKLLRSVAWKGVALVVVEAIAAARAVDEELWMRDEILALLADADIDRLLEGSELHAVRREHEMQDVVDQLRELGVEPRMSAAARDWLAELGRRG